MSKKYLNHKYKNNIKGFTLVEALVGTAIFAILAISVYQAYLTTMSVVSLSRVKITATALANEQFEIIRNLPYSDIGIVAGLPLGKIPATQTLTRDNKEFTIKTTIRSIDDPFDGTIDGTPNDSSPADYKLAEIEITCTTCRNFPPMNLTTYVSPKNLENTSNNGAIFVRVYNAVGQPVPGALVHIENNQTIPHFTIDDTTNIEGLLQIIDAPPGAQAYEISVSKPGYTSEKTYAIGGLANPAPEKPHATVLAQQLTQISFIIDKVSILNISSVNNICGTVPSIDFTLKGQKIIGVNTQGTDILKYDKAFITDNSGLKTISDVEWDTYNLALTDTEYVLAGSIPSTAFTLSPDITQILKLIVAPKSIKDLLISIKDASTGLPLSGVDVKITSGSASTTETTGLGFIRQTDWSGGAGQTDYTNKTKYFDSDGRVEISSQTGELHIKKSGSKFSTSTWLTSSTIDTGTASNFQKILWQPQDQSSRVGTDSVRMQIATNNNKTTWNYKGPDGTANTYYTITNQNINPINNENRYLRYKIFLTTTNTSYSPVVSDILFTYTSDCLPPGQTFFSGLTNTSYTINISKTGYTTYTGTISTASAWQQYEVTLTP